MSGFAASAGCGLPRSGIASNLSDDRAGPSSFNGGGNSAAGAKFAFHDSPDRVARPNHILKDLIHGIFLEYSQIPVAKEILFPRFQLKALFAGHVAEGNHPEIGKPRLRAYRRELRIVDENLITGKLILPCLDCREIEVQAGFSVFFCITRCCSHTPILGPRAAGRCNGVPLPCFDSRASRRKAAMGASGDRYPAGSRKARSSAGLAHSLNPNLNQSCLIY